MKIRWIGIGLVIIGTALTIIFLLRNSLTRQTFAPTKRIIPTAAPKLSAAPAQDTSAPTKPPATIDVIANNLEIPWELAFLPDGSMLVTERPGRLLKIGLDKQTIPINGVQHVGEGGLLGLALHPDFADNHLIYLYLTTKTGSGLTNRVERYQLEGIALSNRTVIIENIPGAQYHDGGRLAFGPDGKLYITTGDAGTESNAQNKDSLAGKILRLNDDGTVPSDNPFGTAVYSYGHRNPQGLAWDNAGNLWATEHGRSGVLSGYDEVNRIEPGANYGWPDIQGDETRASMETPKVNSGTDETWAPSGTTFWDGHLLFAGLRGQALYDATVDGINVTAVVAHFADQFGRLRTVHIGPDGNIYVLTNNRDGRGTPQANDDKIIRINPALLQSN